MQYDIQLQAGQQALQQVRGTYFALLSLGASSGITVQFYRGNELLEELRNVTRRFKARCSVEFDTLRFTSLNAATVAFVASAGAVDIEGADVQATIVGTPTVDTVRGSPGNLLYVSGVSLADAPATSATAGGPIACSSATAVLCSANASRRALRITNLGPDPVAITPPAGTWAQRVIVLQADETWLDDRAANLPWSAICDAGKTASVTVQGVIA